MGVADRAYQAELLSFLLRSSTRAGFLPTCRCLNCFACFGSKPEIEAGELHARTTSDCGNCLKREYWRTVGFELHLPKLARA